MTLAMRLAIAAVLFVAGVATGIRWHAGQDAITAAAEREVREAFAASQRRYADSAAGNHAAQLATLNRQLGDARAQIARLSGRPCLDPGTVRLLNDTGLQVDGGAAAGQPPRPAPGPTAPAGERDATDVDVAGYIALCRTRYGEVKSQLDQILDIEDRRHPQGKP